MCSNVYEFTKETLEQFKDAGADIGMVQVGNEISQGMMGIMHRTKANVWQEEEKSVLIDSIFKCRCQGSKRMCARCFGCDTFRYS